MLKHIERPEQMPEDVMRLNIALHRLYEHAIRRGLEAEQALEAQEPGQKEATPGLQASGAAKDVEEAA